MRPDRLTTKSQEALREGVDLASRKGNPELLPEHVLLAMLAQDGGVAGDRPAVGLLGIRLVRCLGARVRRLSGAGRCRFGHGDWFVLSKGMNESA